MTPHLIWILDRKPTKKELQIVFKRDQFVVYGGTFLVSDGVSVFLDTFNMPPLEGGKGYHTGYWKTESVKGWMPLPTPPLEPPGGWPR